MPVAAGKGGWRPVGVDLIGGIRRAYFEQHRPIKEIVRTLSVSRATVRKVIRGQATEFRYERGVQPVPKLNSSLVMSGALLQMIVAYTREAIALGTIRGANMWKAIFNLREEPLGRSSTSRNSAPISCHSALRPIG